MSQYEREAYGLFITVLIFAVIGIFYFAPDRLWLGLFLMGAFILTVLTVAWVSQVRSVILAAALIAIDCWILYSVFWIEH